MTVTATYDSGDLKVAFSAEIERSDYGVKGSPVWSEVLPETITVETLEICGVSIDIKVLPKLAQDAIRALASEINFE